MRKKITDGRQKKGLRREIAAEKLRSKRSLLEFDSKIERDWQFVNM